MSLFRPAAMWTLRRSAPIIQGGCQSIGSRYFHLTPLTRAAARSPRVLARDRKSKPRQPVMVKKAYDIEECLPPLVLLNSARKSGALLISPEQALTFLRQYQTLAETSATGWELKLCSDHGVTPSTLALLAGIVGKCEGRGQQLLGKKLMYAASALGDPAATFSIVSTALSSGKVGKPDIAGPLQQVGLLAKRDNDPQAMTLLGQVLYSQRGEREALEWFRKATRPPTGTLEFDGAGDALVTEGRILLQWKDTEGAKEAFKKAALDLDDPSAYFYLSQLEDPGSKSQTIYLLKAATSGVLEAWHNLGALELAKVEKGPTKPTSMKDYGMASEWFHVAAADGFGLSMLNLALMNKAVGETEEAWKWLEKAREVHNVREQADAVKSQWLKEEDQVDN